MGKSKNRWVAAKTRSAEVVMAQYLDRIPPDFRLGTLCRYGHEFEDSGFSLRYMRNANCVECSRVTIRRHRLLKSLARLTGGKHDYLTTRYRTLTDPDLILAEIERLRIETGFKQTEKRPKFWGPPCRHGHANPETGKCLRYSSAGKECVECTRDKAQRWKAKQKAAGLKLQNPGLADVIEINKARKTKSLEEIRAEYLAAQQELKRIEIMERRMAR